MTSKLGTLRHLTTNDLNKLVCILELLTPDLDIAAIVDNTKAVPVVIKVTSELNSFVLDDIYDVCKFARQRSLGASITIDNGVLTFSIY